MRFPKPQAARLAGAKSWPHFQFSLGPNPRMCDGPWLWLDFFPQWYIQQKEDISKANPSLYHTSRLTKILFHQFLLHNSYLDTIRPFLLIVRAGNNAKKSNLMKDLSNTLTMLLGAKYTTLLLISIARNSAAAQLMRNIQHEQPRGYCAGAY